MAYNLPDGVTQGMVDAELGDDEGGCEGCPECMEPKEGELIPMPNINLSHCFSCPAEMPYDGLLLCQRSQECIDHVGALCVDCMDAHISTKHNEEEAAA